MTSNLTDFEEVLLQWVLEHHGGNDEVDTVCVLIGFGDNQFKRALDGLEKQGLVETRGKTVAVTRRGIELWEKTRGPTYRAEQAQHKLRKLIDGNVNSLVCGGTRQNRWHAIEWAAINQRLGNQYHTPTAKRGVENELEGLPDDATHVVVFHDAHRIPGDLLWAIRSVAQTQRNTVYIFEGANRNHMIDMVARYKAAFYQQLTIVDLDSFTPLDEDA